MLAQGVFVWCDCRGRAFCGLRRGTFEIFAENVFRGARLARDFVEADKSWFRQPSVADCVDRDGLLLGVALENHRSQVLNTSWQLGRAAKSIIELLNFLMQGGGALEIELLAGAFSFLLEEIAEGAAAGVEELDQALHLDIVVLFRA